MNLREAEEWADKVREITKCNIMVYAQQGTARYYLQAWTHAGRKKGSKMYTPEQCQRFIDEALS